MTAMPDPVRIRHEPRRRLLQVCAVQAMSPLMRRIVVSGPALDGFVSLAADDHVKLFFPGPSQSPVVTPDLDQALDGPKRDYTPSRFDPVAGTLAIDFVLHGDGPAASWAASARPGYWLGVGGPRGSRLPPNDGRFCLLVGDETALPSISRRLEEMQPGRSCSALVEVADRNEIRPLPTAADVRMAWLSRDGAPAGSTALLDRALGSLALPAGPIEVWIAAETDTARRLRDHLVNDRGIERAQVHAAGYWKRDAAPGHENIPVR